MTPIMPMRMSFQTLWGMRLIKRFNVLGERFKTRAGLLFLPQNLPDQFDLAYPPPDPAAAIV
ncbi:hypothetical protein Hanom_Chr12g01124191 [Helianthus anomalus]